MKRQIFAFILLWIFSLNWPNREFKMGQKCLILYGCISKIDVGHNQHKQIYFEGTPLEIFMERKYPGFNIAVIIPPVLNPKFAFSLV